MLKLYDQYRSYFPETTLEEFCALDGEVFKRIQNRRTFRIEREGRGFFIKCHHGVGWGEIVKNLSQLRSPILGAGSEWRAIHRLQELGVETMTPVAYGQQGWNPAAIDSLLITEELQGCVSLESYTERWQKNPPDPSHKRTLIKRLAQIARTLHENGVNHRDFYLCHFMIADPWDGTEANLQLYVIDLHRVQIRQSTPQRWLVKDIGSLWFSAMQIGLTRRDLLRFMRIYRDMPLRQTLQQDGEFWGQVAERARALDATRPPPKGDNNSYLLDNGQEVVCLEVVRSLPGRRLVFLGEYAGAKVFVKMYLDPQRGPRHWQRELDGLKAFQQGAIPTADLLYAGRSADRGWPVIVLAELTGMQSAKHAWSEADTECREQIVKRMAVLLARHHRSGLCQTDLHLGNFLLSDQEIFSLDGAGVTVSNGELDRESSLQNLALFIAQLPPEWESYVSEVYKIYAAERGWQGDSGAETLLRQVQLARAGRWREFRHKLLRNCTAFSYTKHSDGFQVIAREYTGHEMSALLRDPDASFPGADQALKNGNTCTVWATTLNGLGVVIKRYNVKGFWHGLKLVLLEGRCVRSWVNGYRLMFYGIPTPKPIALLKRRDGLLGSKAYLLAEQVSSVSAQEWFNDPAVAGEEKKIMAARIAQILQGLQQQQISHGDLKASNILIGAGEAMLIDLDAMRQHTSPAKFKQAWAKDIQRFLKNWQDDKELLELFTNSLKSCGIVAIS